MYNQTTIDLTLLVLEMRKEIDSMKNEIHSLKKEIEFLKQKCPNKFCPKLHNITDFSCQGNSVLSNIFSSGQFTGQSNINSSRLNSMTTFYYQVSSGLNFSSFPSLVNRLNSYLPSVIDNRQNQLSILPGEGNRSNPFLSARLDNIRQNPLSTYPRADNRLNPFLSARLENTGQNISPTYFQNNTRLNLLPFTLLNNTGLNSSSSSRPDNMGLSITPESNAQQKGTFPNNQSN